MIPVLFPEFFDYTAEDVERCRQLSLGTLEATEDDIARYDKNGDGMITNVDLVTVRNIFLSGASFETNGIGALSDALSCDVVQEINGQYELTMKYPVNGALFNDIALRAIIKATPDRISGAQPFRIYRITKPINGIITIYARHIAYDLAGVTVSPFETVGVADTLREMPLNSPTYCPFAFETDMSSNDAFAVAVPTDIWSLMGTGEGQILGVYGGEYEFDRYTVRLYGRRGTDRGVSIRYGKNMTSLEQDANCAACYTGVYPYWQKDGVLITLPERVLRAEGNYNYTKIMPLDLSSEIKEEPTADLLRATAAQYMTDNDIGTPTVSWTVEFVQLEQSEEFAGAALFERVYLGDDVSVEFPNLGVSAKARAVGIDYNVLLDRYNSVSLGSVKSNLADTIVSQGKEIAKKPSRTMLESIVSNLTNTILGAAGGSVRILDTDGDDMPDTLYIADDPDPAQAVRVWRWNYAGWAASENGYNGPFKMGATLEDGLLADFVTAANLTAGTIRSSDGKTFLLELDNGTIFTTYETVYPVANYTSEDQTRVISIILGDITPTEEDFAKYDFYRDGKITNTDLVTLRNMLNFGEDHIVSWKVSLDPTNNANILRIWRESTVGSNDTNVAELLNIGIGGGRIMLGDPVEETDGANKGYVDAAIAEKMLLFGAVPKYIGTADYTLTSDDAGKIISLAYAIRNEEVTITLDSGVTLGMAKGTEIAIIRSWGTNLTIKTTGIRMGVPGVTSNGVGGLTTAAEQQFVITKPFGTAILKKVDQDANGEVWILQGDVEMLNFYNRTLTITAGQSIPINLKPGQIMQVAYLTSSQAAANITLKVNGAAPDGGYYTPAQENNIYSGGIITYGGSTVLATAQFSMQIVNDRLIVWGTGIRGNGSGFGTFNAFWRTTAPTSFAISHAGTVVYKKIQ